MVYRMEDELHAARLDSATSRLQNINAQADNEQAAAARALEYGNYAEHAQHQRNLARLAAEGVHAEQQKQWLEAQPQRQQPVGDPIENYINQVAQQTPNSAGWLRNHRDWITDPKKSAKLTAAHWDAVGEGVVVDSPEYFARVEKTIGLSEPSKPGSPSASEVRLTPSEVAAATDGSVCWGREGGAKCGQPLGPVEYARRKSAMRAAAGNPWYGKLD